MNEPTKERTFFESPTTAPPISPPETPRSPNPSSRPVLTSGELERLDGPIDDLWPVLIKDSEQNTVERLLVCGAGPGVGTTTVALMAAAGLAQHLFTATVLVETNFGSPSLAQAFNLPVSQGLRRVLEGTTDVASAIVETGVPFLSVLPAGAPTPSFPGAFARPSARPVLEYLEGRFTHVIYDAPPLTEVPDARLLLDEVDAAIVVAAAGETPRHEVRRAVELVQDSGTEFLGVVLNRFRPDAPEWLVPGRSR
ncbi:MAG: CpsD/CapB family tyrosine-protein kinase [Planctomycetota bacterium]